MVEGGAVGDSGRREDEEESDEEIEWMGRIQQQIFRLWIVLLNQPL